MQEAAQLLWNIIKKYGIDVSENYSEESGKLQQMLQELGTRSTSGRFALQRTTRPSCG